MPRYTAIGSLFRDDDDAGREELIEALQRCAGNLCKVAHELHLSRRHLYRILWRENLWTVVDEARQRATAAKMDWYRRTRAALGG